MAAKVEPLVVSVSDTAVMLGVSTKTVWNMVKDGRLRSVRIGDRVLVPVAEINRIVGEAK